MSADLLLQDLAVRIYEPPLSGVRDRDDYPDLRSPLDVAVLLIDCDTELAMNSVLGFLENSTGMHLDATIDALIAIGASLAAARLTAVRDVMRRHGVTWRMLRQDFERVSEFQITTFSDMHGRDAFAREVCEVAGAATLFESSPDEDVYRILCDYLDQRFELLTSEIERKKWLTSRQSLRRCLSRSVLAHSSRQPAPWLIYNVGR